MGRFYYKPSKYNEESLKVSEEREVNIDDKHHLIVYDDYKIPIDKIDLLERELKKVENEPNKLKTRVMNDYNLINSLSKRYNLIEDKIFGKYHYNYETNQFDYDDKIHSITAISDKYEEVHNETIYEVGKLDYCKSVYEYNRYSLNLIEPTLEDAYKRLDELEIEFNKINSNYSDIENIIIDESFWKKYENDTNDIIDDTIIKVDSLPSFITKPGDVITGGSFDKQDSKIVTKYEYGFVRWLSSNNKTYPGDHKRGRWYSYSAPPCHATDWYTTKPVSVSPCNHGRKIWVAFSAAIGQPGFIWPPLSVGNTDAYYVPNDVENTYYGGNWRALKSEWLEIADENWGCSYTPNREKYNPSLDRPGGVLYKQKVPKDLSYGATRDPDRNRAEIQRGNWTYAKHGAGNTHSLNLYGKWVRITYAVDIRVNVNVSVPL